MAPWCPVVEATCSYRPPRRNGQAWDVCRGVPPPRPTGAARWRAGHAPDCARGRGVQRLHRRQAHAEGAALWRRALARAPEDVRAWRGAGSTYDADPNGTRSQAAANQPRPLSSSGAPPPRCGCEHVRMARHRRCCCTHAMRGFTGHSAQRMRRPGRSLHTLSEPEACKKSAACHGRAS